LREETTCAADAGSKIEEPSLVVALLDRLFEHPVGHFPIGQDVQTIEILA
jgi:hypothetical protein